MMSLIHNTTINTPRDIKIPTIHNILKTSIYFYLYPQYTLSAFSGNLPLSNKYLIRAGLYLAFCLFTRCKLQLMWLIRNCIWSWL